MKRRLGKMERALVFVDNFSSLIIVVVLRMVNGPPPEILQRALAILQKRRPLLRVQIEQKGGRLHFQTPAHVPPIPLQISERQDDHQWQTDTEAEINRKLDPATAPLLKLWPLRPESSRKMWFSTAKAASSWPMAPGRR